MNIPPLSILLPLLLATAGCLGTTPSAEPIETATTPDPVDDNADPAAEDAAEAPDTGGASGESEDADGAEEAEPEPPAQNETAPESPPPTEDPAPAPRAPYEAVHEGWVQMNGADPFTVEYTLPVDPGAVRVFVEVAVKGVYPVVETLPRQTANVTVDLITPTGGVAGTGHRDFTSDAASAVVDLTPLPENGVYQVKVLIYGGSDGAETGDKYTATLRVEY